MATPYRIHILVCILSGDSPFEPAEASRTLMDMNTMKSAMRTVLAATAAGALVLGSAGGAIAHPTKKSTPAEPKLQSVSIKGHSPVNVFSITSDRTITVRATVRYAKATPEVMPTGTVTLAAYTKKVNGDPITLATDALEPITADLASSSKTKRDVRLKAEIALLETQVGALQAAVAANTKVYLCIAAASVTESAAEDAPSIDGKSTKVKKRLGLKGKKPVRDCVKVISVDPTTTETTADDE